LVPALFVTCGLFSSVARAEQFIVTEVSYTHSKDTTTDSHYRVAPLSGTPTNWKSPVDYTAGSVHVRLEVKTKPTDTPTKFQICFEGTPGYGCTTYTKTGSYEWTTKFSAFYLGDGGPDWSKGVSKVALILKDTENNKPQGDPNYVPTDLRVQVAVVSGGATFVPPPSEPPPSTPTDAGTGDAAQRPLPPDAGPSASPVDASTGAPQPRDAATASGNTGSKDAATAPTPSRDAGTTTSDDPVRARDGGAGTDTDDKQKDGGCNLGTSPLSDALPLVGGLLMMALARRKRRSVQVMRRR
jgi:hypothetical protein